MLPKTFREGLANYIEDSIVLDIIDRIISLSLKLKYPFIIGG